MRILDRFLNKKNKLVQPKIIVEETKEEPTLLYAGTGEEDRTYHSTWHADIASSTGRSYRVQIYGEMGTVEGSGETLAVAMSDANKKYDKKVR